MGGPPGSPIVIPGELAAARGRPAGVRRVTLLLCILLALAGCARLGGGGAAQPSDGKPDSPIGTTPGTETPPPGDGALREEPDATVFDAHAVAIDHFTIGPDGRTVVVFWWGGTPACFGLKEIQTQMRDGRPTITVLEGTRQAARGKACTMEARLKSAVAILDDPIVADAANPDPEAGEAVIFPGAALASPVGGVRNARPHAVSGYELAGDGLTLFAYYVGGVDQCYGLASATATRDPATGQVAVSIREGWIGAEGVACDDIGVTKVVRLELDEPLIAAGGVDAEPSQPAS